MLHTAIESRSVSKQSVQNLVGRRRPFGGVTPDSALRFSRFIPSVTSSLYCTMSDSICVKKSRSAKMLLHQEDSKQYPMIFRFFLMNIKTTIKDQHPRRTLGIQQYSMHQFLF